MHLAMTLPPGLNDREIALRAARSRLWLYALSTSYMSQTPRHGFILGYGSCIPSQIPRSVRLLHSIVSSA
jgi:DNA-binding transcriptional MocR family regulator